MQGWKKLEKSLGNKVGWLWKCTLSKLQGIDKIYQNKNYFHISKNELCKICVPESIYKFCPARKYAAYKQLRKAQVFHVENHSYKAKNT